MEALFFFSVSVGNNNILPSSYLPLFYITLLSGCFLGFLGICDPCQSLAINPPAVPITEQSALGMVTALHATVYLWTMEDLKAGGPVAEMLEARHMSGSVPERPCA